MSTNIENLERELVELIRLTKLLELNTQDSIKEGYRNPTAKAIANDALVLAKNIDTIASNANITATEIQTYYAELENAAQTKKNQADAALAGDPSLTKEVNEATIAATAALKEKTSSTALKTRTQDIEILTGGAMISAQNLVDTIVVDNQKNKENAEQEKAKVMILKTTVDAIKIEVSLESKLMAIDKNLKSKELEINNLKNDLKQERDEVDGDQTFKFGSDGNELASVETRRSLAQNIKDYKADLINERKESDVNYNFKFDADGIRSLSSRLSLAQDKKDYKADLVNERKKSDADYDFKFNIDGARGGDSRLSLAQDKLKLTESNVSLSTDKADLKTDLVNERKESDSNYDFKFNAAGARAADSRLSLAQTLKNERDITKRVVIGSNTRDSLAKQLNDERTNGNVNLYQVDGSSATPKASRESYKKQFDDKANALTTMTSLKEAYKSDLVNERKPDWNPTQESKWKNINTVGEKYAEPIAYDKGSLAYQLQQTQTALAAKTLELTEEKNKQKTGTDARIQTLTNEITKANQTLATLKSNHAKVQENYLKDLEAINTKINNLVDLM
uniref:Uncharacterized protein n=1 Tax=viral metagenome TaxID=1070528 RepID=A0A6C0C3Q0_9ZZZZ